MESRLLDDSINTGICQIVINIDKPHFIFHDSFLWNVLNPECDAKDFVKSLCSDLHLNDKYIDDILLEMNHEIARYKNIINNRLIEENENSQQNNLFDIMKQYFMVTSDYNSINTIYSQIDDAVKLQYLLFIYQYV